MNINMIIRQAAIALENDYELVELKYKTNILIGENKIEIKCSELYVTIKLNKRVVYNKKYSKLSSVKDFQNALINTMRYAGGK